MATSLNATVEKLLKSHIAHFRAAVASLDDSVRGRLSNLEDFSAPCQIHFFWFRAGRDVNYSLLLRTALRDTDDGVVKVVGPVAPGRAVETLLDEIKSNVWDEQVEEGMFIDPSLRGQLTSRLASARDNLDAYIVLRAYDDGAEAIRIPQQMIFPGNGFTWDVYGDPRDLDSKSLIESDLRRAQLAYDAARKASGTVPSAEKSTPELPAFVTWFFPHMWIGDLPALTAEEVLRKRVPRELTFTPKAFDAEHRGKKVVVNRDGMIALEYDSPRQALGSLNRIMGALLLSGLDARTVREADLGQGKLEPDALTVRSWGGTITSRSPQWPSFNASRFDVDMIGLTRQQVTEDQLRSVLSLAETLAADAYLDTVSSLFLEAHTHFRESAYRQCLLMAWMVIESWLAREWTAVVEEFKTSASHRDRLTDSRTWTAAVKAETLRMLNVIDSSQLHAITAYRNKRNDVIHDSYDPNASEAETILEFARELTLRALPDAPPA